MINAVIIDLDGTLCNSMHISGFTDVNGTVNWGEWAESTAFATRNEWCTEIVNAFAAQGTHIIFLTARIGTARHRKITKDWLNNFGFGHITNSELLMRDEDDKRQDYIIKEEIYHKYIAPKYNVLFAIDDKHTVISMWRKLGVPALHCADY